MNQAATNLHHDTDMIVNMDMLERDLAQHREAFQSAIPFRYLVIDQFCHPAQAQTLAQLFPKRERSWVDASGLHAKKKWTSPVIQNTAAAQFFKEVQSERFTLWLEALTGIKGFIHDEEYFGAGFHQTADEGFLNVHIDFNQLPNGLDRRLNLLVYMNPQWHEDWGGELELWDMSKNKCFKKVQPILNRAVIFETNEISYHGHPKPVQTIGRTTRNSFSVYYYTQGRPHTEQAEYHSTVYVNTEGSQGKFKLLKNTFDQLLTLKPLTRRIAIAKKKFGWIK